MCGVAGLFAYGGGAADAAELARICARMAPRGPDGEGAWISPDRAVGLGHRRLSIIDLSDAAAQPMASADGRCIITFNGEIYNFRALRRRLEANGCAFRSQSDTEVLLHLYAEQGEAMVRALRGMFAFAIWDAQKRALFLARDPYGVKPLYWSNSGGTFRFASQVKALIAGGAISAEPDAAGWAGFHVFGAVPEPFTTYRQIHALPRGSTMWVDQGGPKPPQRYFSVAGVYAEAEAEPARLGEQQTRQYVREALLDSVRHHLVADVPVGAFLSAGVDSASLLGLMRDAGQQEIETVTLAFEEYRGTPRDEAPLAQAAARQYGARHTVRWVGEAEFQQDLPRILDAMDQPSIDGVNTWFVSKAARELGLKVAISGLGGDELMGGYSTFREAPRLARWMAVPSRVPALGAAAGAAVRALRRAAPRISPKAAGLVQYGGTLQGAYLLRRALFMPWELETVLPPEIAREGLARLDPLRLIGETLTPAPRTSFARVASLESELYMGNQLLRDADWASMAHSLEVRVPLVDAELLRRMAPLTVARQTLDGKSLLGGSPSAPLPQSILNRPKTGFSMPYEQWFAHAAPAKPRTETPRLGAGASWGRRWAAELTAAFA